MENNLQKNKRLKQVNVLFIIVSLLLILFAKMSGWSQVFMGGFTGGGIHATFLSTMILLGMGVSVIIFIIGILWGLLNMVRKKPYRNPMIMTAIGSGLFVITLFIAVVG